MTDLIGQTIGQYLIIEEIGRGGMATVYRGFQTRIGRDVAIKVLPAQFTHDPTFLARFTREVEIAARLQHHRILPVYDYGEYEGQPYIVMAYMPGGNLEERIAEGALPLADALPLVEQIAEGLDYLHAGGIIHRDFKPSNVLLDASGSAFLCDFGIARVQEATAHLTGTGIIGTPAYMAPEMFREGEASPASDIYALGVTLYEMLSGYKPFDAETPVQYMRAHLEKPVPDARHIIPDLPLAVQRVIAIALAKDPSMRYPSAGALAAALHEAVYPTPKRAATGRQRGIPILPLAALGGVVVLGVVVAGIFLALRGSGMAQPGQVGQSAATNTVIPTDIPTVTSVPSPTPIPVIGGGTGTLGFNTGGIQYGYTVDVSCVVAGGSGCSPTPNILPAIDGISLTFGRWSPDGKQLVFTTQDGNPQQPNLLYVADMESRTLTRASLVDTPSGFTSSAAWSHDGQFLAFVSGSGYWSWDLTQHQPYDPGGIMLAESRCFGTDGCAARVPNTASPDEVPLWAPDGSRLLIRQRPSQASNGGLFVIDLDGSNRVYLPFSGGAFGQGYWMRDSRRILYLADSGLYIADAGGAQSTRIPIGKTILPPGVYAQVGMALSPDNRYLALTFTLRADADSDLYLLDLSCVESDPLTCPDFLLQITDNDVDEGSLSWSPDGQWLAFVRAKQTLFQASTYPGPEGIQHININTDVHLLDIDQAVAGAGESAMMQITHLGSVTMWAWSNQWWYSNLAWQSAPGN